MFFNIKNYKFDKIIYSVLGLLLSLILTIIFIKYPILLPITTVVVSYPLYCFLKLRKMKKLRCLNLFEDNGFRGANLLLKELVPFESFDNLISINIKLKEEIYGKDMEYFNDNLAYYCDQKKILFMGFKYEQYKLSYKVYLYADKYDLENLEKFLKKNINYEFEIKVVKDKKYEYYLNHICPSDKLFMHMCNNNIINNKIPETVNLFEEQSIILVLAIILLSNLFVSSSYLRLIFFLHFSLSIRLSSSMDIIIGLLLSLFSIFKLNFCSFLIIKIF
jgi:hypothetical protein